MSLLEAKFVLRAYDHVCPLFLGDAPTPGIKLHLDHRAPLTLDVPESIDIAEISLNRYVVGHARGDNSLVGMPAFILRGFRHRNFFVHADSPLTTLSELSGRRVGTNAWPDTGTMWARAAMRDAGVEVDDVQWVIGQLDAETPNKPESPSDAFRPGGAEYLAPDDYLVDALREGRIDALTTAFAPDDVFRRGGTIRRLVRNYREVEVDYYRRTGVYPGFHIVAARREFAERHPWALMVIYRALQQAFDLWVTKVKRFSEASPWAMDELETMLGVFAHDTPPFGMESPAHRLMLETMCQEQYAQRLVARPAKPADLFADFAEIAATSRDSRVVAAL
jgi:4,5-dihydroxyphthalate decarboxylase